jgi:hypothetical protein
MAREIGKRAGGEVRVLNSAKLPYIWDAPIKTDKEDAMKPAHLLEERRDEKLPVVPLRERYLSMTMTKGKKHSIRAIARRLTELLYSQLKNKTVYEERPWQGGNSGGRMAEEALSA